MLTPPELVLETGCPGHQHAFLIMVATSQTLIGERMFGMVTVHAAPDSAERFAQLMVEAPGTVAVGAHQTEVSLN